MAAPDLTDPTPPEPANLRFLRLLVTTLTAVMICGLVVIVALLVIRFPAEPTVSLPGQIALPGEARAIAVTAAPDWYAVVTDDNRLHLFRRSDGQLFQTVIVSNP